MKRKGIRMRLDNVVLLLMVTGQAQGFFEMGFNTDSIVDWELAEEKSLFVEVKPRA